MKLDFPERLYTSEPNVILYQKKIFYTSFNIELWSLTDQTICSANFIFDNGRRWRTIKKEEFKQIVDHANKMHNLEKVNNDH